MTLKNIFTLALFSLLLNSSAVFAADNSAVLGKWTLDMSVHLRKNQSWFLSPRARWRWTTGGTWAGPVATNTLSDF